MIITMMIKGTRMTIRKMTATEIIYGMRIKMRMRLKIRS